jgi:beta-galactosidase
MEDIGQAYGYILYRAKPLIHGSSADLAMDSPHDYASVFADGKLAGTLDRRLAQNKLTLAEPTGPYTSKVLHLDLLVENMGRINYSKQLRTDRKGMGQFVSIDGDPVFRWQIYSLPMTNPGAIHFKKTDCTGPCFYRGSFEIDRPADTFLDTSNLSKGQLWINGHALGRFWKIGPQKTLYVPGPWLKPGANEVIVFDVDGHPDPTLEGLAKPNLGD